jgi:peptidoglycan hydrolase-like protein with peptidoglycan-binding domain
MTATMTERAAPRRPRRRGALISVAVVVVVVGVSFAGAARLGGGGTVKPPRTTATGVATVTRTTLVEATTVDGVLDHGPDVPVHVAATGIVTWLPAPGTTLRRGDAIVRVDDQPVVLLYGALPMYRALAPDARGRDVRQLEANLRALGVTAAVPDEVYTAATAAAVKRWQTRLGVAETGTVAASAVVYAPGAVRVARTTVRIGEAAPTDVVTYTSTERVVVAQVSAASAAWAVPGTRVDVVLPDGRTVAGTVRSTTADVAAPAEGGEAKVVVVVAMADQRTLGRLDRALVGVRHVVATRKDVLAVPVTALVALAEGGYGVELADAAPGTFVAVRSGMFADALVEVSGDGVRDGLRVRVPR